MNTQRLIGSALAAALLASLPAAASAQDAEGLTPEGVEWRLTSYYDSELDESVIVPFVVESTLFLQDGIASGSGGCNQFSGTYEIDGTALRFGEEMTVTLALCDDAVQLVEDAYLAALGDVDGWFIDGETLELSDGLGDVLLSFEVPNIMWTSSQLAGLVATLESLQSGMAELQTEVVTLRDDMEALNVDKLRERVKALESENKRVKKRLDALEEGGTSTPPPNGGTSFSKAEKTLLKGIPSRVANYCSPLRSSLPKGTKAAVTCQPNTSAVSNVNYYLMEGKNAASIYGTVMDTYNVPDAVSSSQTCEQGVKSQRQWLANGWQADGCYRTDGRAEVRFVDNATDCKRLKVGGTTLPNPAFYISLQGSGKDVEAVYGWAAKNVEDYPGQLTSITQPIPSNLGTSPSCPS